MGVARPLRPRLRVPRRAPGVLWSSVPGLGRRAVGCGPWPTHRPKPAPWPMTRGHHGKGARGPHTRVRSVSISVRGTSTSGGRTAAEPSACCSSSRASGHGAGRGKCESRMTSSHGRKSRARDKSRARGAAYAASNAGTLSTPPALMEAGGGDALEMRHVRRPARRPAGSAGGGRVRTARRDWRKAY